MVDDFIVFALALWAFSQFNFATKYAQLSNLIGGMVMLILGLLLIFFHRRSYFNFMTIVGSRQET